MSLIKVFAQCRNASKERFADRKESPVIIDGALTSYMERVTERLFCGLSGRRMMSVEMKIDIECAF